MVLRSFRRLDMCWAPIPLDPRWRIDVSSVTEEVTMYHVLTQTDVPPANRQDYVALVHELARDSLQTEPGTLVYDVIQDEENPNRFYVSESYTDKASFDAHMQGPVTQRYFPQLLPLIDNNFTFLGKGFTIGPAEG